MYCISIIRIFLKKVNIVFIVILLSISPLYSAFDYPAFSAQNAGLGNSYLASTFVKDGFLLNPALAVNLNSFYAAFNYFQLFNLKELRYSNGLFAFPWMSMGMGVGIEGFGSSLYQESRVSFHIAREFYQQKIAIGTAIRGYFIASPGYKNSSAIGIDLGFRYQVLNNLHFAATLENINSPNINGYQQEIPQRIQFGLQYLPVSSLVTYLNIQKDSQFSPEIALGIACQLFDQLRLYSGYSTLATIPSLGIGLDVSKINIDYALQYHFNLGVTHFVGIAYNK